MGEEGKAGASLSDRAVDWLVALDCGTADRAAFEAWRTADPRHAAAFAQAAATWRRTADPRLSVLLDQPAEAQQPATEPTPPPPAMLSRRAVAGGALAALVATVGTGTFLAWPRRAYAATAVGERRTLILPDGSYALLNTDTRVGWRFDDERDFWIERGEATLLVREAAKPFRLNSDPIDARLGAGKFNLRLERESAQLLVLAGRAAAVYRGTLARTLAAGNALVVDGAGAQVSHFSPAAIAAATAWERGEIVFNGMRLDRALAEFNRYLPEKIVLQDADLAPTRLGGSFRIADPDGFLQALQQGFDIGHRQQGNQIRLFRRRAA
ncbi:DUF4880 domain-containing protein [Sphingomonas sp. MMSM20]|uniref:FecR family protein n=1 Tax=Sphingomonas lycopersici TaxID=2951807 RepID=UPI0022383585|nr:FecR domain-containing protein [Sphingomonas lycopersici]MCW6528776.1 DUF4880 domain-containing protein [Sphingomonas lycopersici]